MAERSGHHHHEEEHHHHHDKHHHHDSESREERREEELEERREEREERREERLEREERRREERRRHDQAHGERLDEYAGGQRYPESHGYGDEDRHHGYSKSSLRREDIENLNNRSDISDEEKARRRRKLEEEIAAGVVGAGILGFAGYAGYEHYNKGHDQQGGGQGYKHNDETYGSRPTHDNQGYGGEDPHGYGKSSLRKEDIENLNNRNDISDEEKVRRRRRLEEEIAAGVVGSGILGFAGYKGYEHYSKSHQQGGGQKYERENETYGGPGFHDNQGYGDEVHHGYGNSSLRKEDIENLSIRTDISDEERARRHRKLEEEIAAGVVGAGILGFAGYKGYEHYNKGHQQGGNQGYEHNNETYGSRPSHDNQGYGDEVHHGYGNSSLKKEDIENLSTRTDISAEEKARRRRKLEEEIAAGVVGAGILGFAGYKGYEHYSKGHQQGGGQGYEQSNETYGSRPSHDNQGYGDEVHHGYGNSSLRKEDIENLSNRTDISDQEKARRRRKLEEEIAAGIVGAGILGFAGYKGYEHYNKGHQQGGQDVEKKHHGFF